ncbi:MAG: hypothetical protein U1A78_17295 [Polyangia bacterium]
MSYVTPWRNRSLSALLLLSLAPAACGGGTVSSSSATVDRTVRALTGASGAPLAPRSIKGTFGAGCQNRSPDGTWELRLNDSSSRFEVGLNETLSGCPLTLTSIGVQVGSQLPAVDYPLSPPVVLSTDYGQGPASVKTAAGAPAFYANARLTGLGAGATRYTNSFVIELLYSDDALACGATAPAAVYAHVDATDLGATVPPPNYAVSFATLQLVVNMGKQVLSSSTGGVVLNPPQSGPQTGEEWRIFAESTACCSSYSFSEIDAFYKNTSPINTGTISGTGPVSIPWERFGLLGLLLPRSRTLFIKHIGSGGVYSYELFQILFPGPN